MDRYLDDVGGDPVSTDRVDSRVMMNEGDN
jgi:hypothetical protein